MNTIFIKVAVSERLPISKGDYFVFYKFNRIIFTKTVEFIPDEKHFFDYGDVNYSRGITHWLEEIELPDDEQI